MGCAGSSGVSQGRGSALGKALQQAYNRASERCGKVAVTGRYHRLPKKVNQYYKLKPDILGSGYNGNVYLATCKKQKGRFAVKGFKLSGLPEIKQQELVAEVDIFLGVDHPNIVRLVDVFEAEDMLYMVMECMEGGHLSERLEACKSFPEEDAADMVWQMLLAVNYLHSQHIVHRDLKLENFLFTSRSSKQIKLIDFGFSRLWEPGDDEMTWNVGTLRHAAPEVLKKSYTSQCDLWSLGTIVFLLLSGKEPFSGNVREVCRSIVQGSYCMSGAEWTKVSEPAKDFVRSLLVVNPEERLTAEKALQHPWITQRQSVGARKPRMDHIADGLIKFAQASAFRRACMMMISWSLSAEDEAELYEAFLAADTARNGTLDLNEFKIVIEKHANVHEEDMQKMFNAIDSNNDSTIHYSDFLSACMMSRTSMCDDMLESAFRRFDKHHTGDITLPELEEIFGGSISKEELQQVVCQASSSGSYKMSREDFFAYLK